MITSWESLHSKGWSVDQSVLRQRLASDLLNKNKPIYILISQFINNYMMYLQAYVWLLKAKINDANLKAGKQGDSLWVSTS